MPKSKKKSVPKVQSCVVEEIFDIDTTDEKHGKAARTDKGKDKAKKKKKEKAIVPVRGVCKDLDGKERDLQWMQVLAHLNAVNRENVPAQKGKKTKGRKVKILSFLP